MAHDKHAHVYTHNDAEEFKAGTFHSRKTKNGIKLIQGKRKDTGETDVHAFVFDANEFREDEARDWLKGHTPFDEENFEAADRSGKRKKKPPEEPDDYSDNEPSADDLDQDAEENAVSKSAPLVNTNDEQRLVYGVVLVPEEYDSQGDIISEEEIQAAAHDFWKRYKTDQAGIGLMHKRVIRGVEPVESYITTSDEVINGTPIKKGSWILVSKVHSDEVWNKIKSGALTGYSVAGKALRTPIEI